MGRTDDGRFEHVVLFIPCIIDNRFSTLNQKMHKLVPFKEKVCAFCCFSVPNYYSNTFMRLHGP